MITNKQAIAKRLGKKIANQMEFRVQELCKLAELVGCHIIIDYKPSNAAFKMAVTYDPAKEPELNFTV